MNKNRLEAFSDGVIAIIITIMVLELKIPHDSTIPILLKLWPQFFSYLLSFLILGIYWNNHHHLLQAAKHVDGVILWANLHLLFWLSLIPFATEWMGEHHFATIPVAFYGIILLCASLAYYLLVRSLLRRQEPNSLLAIAIGRDFKGKISILAYILAIVVSFWNSSISCLLYVAVAILWIIPDRRIECKVLNP